MAKKKSAAEKIQEKFFSELKAVIVDPGGSSHASVKRSLCDLGTPLNQIQLVEDYPAAVEEIENRKPNLVVTDFVVGKHQGTELIEEIEKYAKHDLEYAFVVISGKNSPLISAEAADHCVDSIIFKPFTAQGVKEVLIEAILPKVSPSPFDVGLAIARKALKSGAGAEALGALEKLKEQKPDSVELHSLMGRGLFLEKKLQESEEVFKKALALSEDHYKSMTGYYQVLMEQKKYLEAYQVALKVTEKFPLSTQTLSEFVHLAVMTKNYSEILRYYEKFKELEQSDEKLTKFMAAGLVILGKFYIREEQIDNAIKYFDSAIRLTPQNVLLVCNVIRDLYANDRVDHADNVLKQLSVEVLNSEMMRITQVEMEAEYGSPADAVTLSMKLIKEDISSLTLFRIAILKSIEIGRSKGAVEGILEKARQEFPDDVADLEKTVNEKFSESDDDAA